MSSKSFRSSAGFGKRIEYWIVGRMLKEGLDVYLPVVDDDAVDALIRRPDGSVALVQIKARSQDVVPGNAALFAAIDHPEERADYWFVFYSERIDAMWIMTSGEFINSSNQNKTGKNAGKRSIWFNGNAATRPQVSTVSTGSRDSRSSWKSISAAFGTGSEGERAAQNGSRDGRAGMEGDAWTASSRHRGREWPLGWPLKG